ncbi:zinc ribbon domain-containing protein [candidate division KSB1 bacterium]|nr:zinc ribbon domain-containing protein [candidate division KSB1 bacterium]
MPTYDYLCRDCGHRFEVFQTITSDPVAECPNCTGPAERLFSGGAGFLMGSAKARADNPPCCGRDERCADAPPVCGGCRGHNL